MNVKKVGGCSCIKPPIDEEYRRILMKLAFYGVLPTGNKAADKAKLREIEIKEAKNQDCVSGTFVTVSVSEEEKIQAGKKQKRIENNIELYQDTAKAQQVLGEQIYLAIQMKNQN